jgi:hypothetical protein
MMQGRWPGIADGGFTGMRQENGIFGRHIQ